MRSTSQTWQNIVSNGEFHLESVALIYGATGNDTNGTSGSDDRGSYKQYATITAPIISRSLTSDSALSVGNCNASTLKFTIMTTDSIPKAAMIVIKARVTKPKPVAASDYGEWLEFGTFWVNTRTTNEDLTYIEAFDAMKMANQAYSDNSQTLNWPKTISTVVTRIAEQMGVDIDSRTTAYLTSSGLGDLNIVTKPGDDWVLLDVLKYTAEIMGGNWIITHVNELRFVPLVPATGTVHPAGGGTLDIPVVIGSLTTAMPSAISKVTMWAQKDTVFTYGDDTGIELTVSDNPYATNSLCQALYSRVVGLTYAPYSMTNCVYDPAVELGDWIIAGSKVSSVLYNETATYNIGFSADASAPGKDEIESEYPYQSAMERLKYESTVAGIMSQVTTMIDQSEDSIMAAVNATYVQGGVFSKRITGASLYYLASTSSFGVTDETEGWQTTLPTIDSTNKYLWVHQRFTYSDSTSENGEPAMVCSYDINGVCAALTPIYYGSNIAIPPPSLPAQAVTDTTTTPLHWTKSIPYATSDYPFVHYSYEITATSLYWADAQTDKNTYENLSAYINRSKIALDEYGVLIEAAQEDISDLQSEVSHIPTANNVRSFFALDPTNITLSAGVDGQGHATGVITFNAGALIINSDYFTLNSEGATLNGKLETNVIYPSDPQAVDREVYTVTHEENGIKFKMGNVLKGKLLMQTSVYMDTGGYSYPVLELSNGSGTGIHIGPEGDWAKGIMISPSGSVMTAGLTGYNRDITINNVTLTVRNGIIVDVST